jgi:hypothetical protein
MDCYLLQLCASSCQASAIDGTYKPELRNGDNILCRICIPGRLPICNLICFGVHQVDLCR